MAACSASALLQRSYAAAGALRRRASEFVTRRLVVRKDAETEWLGAASAACSSAAYAPPSPAASANCWTASCVLTNEAHRDAHQAVWKTVACAQGSVLVYWLLAASTQMLDCAVAERGSAQAKDERALRPQACDLAGMAGGLRNAVAVVAVAVAVVGGAR